MGHRFPPTKPVENYKTAGAVVGLITKGAGSGQFLP
jgi:hypothetical protein